MKVRYQTLAIYKVHLRQNTTSCWEEDSPILVAGELAVTKDDSAQFLVIGDGVSSFKDLPRIRLEMTPSEDLYLVCRDGRWVPCAIERSWHHVK